jgi:hypothetical protein
MSTPACSHTHGNVIAHVQGCAYGRGSRVPSRTERELQQGSMREQGVELPVAAAPTKNRECRSLWSVEQRRNRRIRQPEEAPQ